MEGRLGLILASVALIALSALSFKAGRDLGHIEAGLESIERSLEALK